MSEFEPTPEAPRPAINHRRLEVAARRFESRITDGINRAHDEHRELDLETARMVAHVLGRSFGRDSALAVFGREGEGTYEAVRNEYLGLYSDEQVGSTIKQWIDWLGTYFVQRDKDGSGRQFQNEHLPPKLNRVLYRDTLDIGGDAVVVHIPGSTTGPDAQALAHQLRELPLSEHPALQAYLTLPDVDATAGNLSESFQVAYAGSYASEEAALRGLSPLEDWENELADWCIDNGVDHEALTWNYPALMERLRGVYDVVELGGELHAFNK